MNETEQRKMQMQEVFLRKVAAFIAENYAKKIQLGELAAWRERG